MNNLGKLVNSSKLQNATTNGCGHELIRTVDL